MSTDTTAMYEARISTVPYAATTLPHLLTYLVSMLESVVTQHSLVRTVDLEVEKGPEYDTVTTRIRFEAATYTEASTITHAAGDRVGTTDEHWRLVGVVVEQVERAL
ncbi:hypothetical protein [Cellulomonas hominis]|uniref:hypothetical protein n=1 Tax=Cellulomonas hominis TaxID=156981 RepID=UPI001B94B74A|nr:hypothetical protein [Cellulomonas hominis]VTR75476.1 hypothetical protein CHMI_00222 [Cellulomonas hominis]